MTSENASSSAPVDAVVSTQWVSWCRIQAGNDGRRPSGVVKTRTTLRHATTDGEVTLCGRTIQLYPSDRDDLPKCPQCVKKSC